jgi:hypothetical protein
MATRTLESISTKIVVKATILNTLSTSPLKTIRSQVSQVFDPVWTSGVSANQANRAWEYNATISGTTSLDLYDFTSFNIGAGAGLDAAGQVLTLEEIVYIGIYNKPTSVGTLEIDANAGLNPTQILGTNDVANGAALKPGGFMAASNPHEDGFEVSPTQFTIELVPVGGNCDVQVLVIGRHDSDESSSSSSSSSNSSSSSSST